jgi:hypothetical protein
VKKKSPSKLVLLSAVVVASAACFAYFSYSNQAKDSIVILQEENSSKENHAQRKSMSHTKSPEAVDIQDKLLLTKSEGNLQLAIKSNDLLKRYETEFAAIDQQIKEMSATRKRLAALEQTAEARQQLESETLALNERERIVFKRRSAVIAQLQKDLKQF